MPLILFGAFIAPAYNLEWLGGRFHTDFWLAASWAGFAALTGWWVNALGLHSAAEAVAVAAALLACACLVTAQRRLSTPVRELRRRTRAVAVRQEMNDGSIRERHREDLIRPLDSALEWLSAAVPLLAAALLAFRL